MKRACLLLIVLVWLSAPGAAQERESVRFAHVDIYLDSQKEPLAAFQLELLVKAGSIAIVGIEGGEHSAFKEPPCYDPAALMHDRVILAAFNTSKDLPQGRTRVARVHLQVTGPVEPKYQTKLTAAASLDGKVIPVTISLEAQGDSK